MTNLKPIIIEISGKKLVGMHDAILQSEKHKIGQLWQRFMPKKQNIVNNVDSTHIAAQDYDLPNDLDKPFKIWAAVEVSNFETIPEGMSKLNIPAGLYAVFTLKGMDIGGLYQDIMTTWLPNSGYGIDSRPHFQVMDERYKNGSPDSEEDIYLPITKVQ